MIQQQVGRPIEEHWHLLYFVWKFHSILILFFISLVIGTLLVCY